MLSLKAYLHQPLRLLHAQHAQHDGVDHAEDGGIGSDAERQRDHGHSREAGIAAQLPQTVANILQEALDIVHPAHVAALLLEVFHSAHFAQGRVTGFLRRRTPCDLLLNQFLKVEAKLVGKLLLNTITLDERTKSK